jgi:hypothetical protein
MRHLRTTLPPVRDESAEGATDPGPVIFRFDDVDVLIQACSGCFVNMAIKYTKAKTLSNGDCYR